mmetsp:Transcript_1511/g.4586  ORF Transcript_1511/g.4586 Transcript_1511/m.4586 type:complete len:216 (+) Transcript_1511:1949-2596(+)
MDKSWRRGLVSKDGFKMEFEGSWDEVGCLGTDVELASKKTDRRNTLGIQLVRVELATLSVLNLAFSRWNERRKRDPDDLPAPVCMLGLQVRLECELGLLIILQAHFVPFAVASYNKTQSSFSGQVQLLLKLRLDSAEPTVVVELDIALKAGELLAVLLKCLHSALTDAAHDSVVKREELRRGGLTGKVKDHLIVRPERSMQYVKCLPHGHVVDEV